MFDLLLSSKTAEVLKGTSSKTSATVQIVMYNKDHI